MADNRLRFGIEHEVAFVRLPAGGGAGPEGHAGAEFADFTNTCAGELHAVVDALPVHLDDGLQVDRARHKVGRWYVEGYDRYDEAGRYLGCDPKGIEIRTPVCDTVGETVATLRHAAGRLSTVATRRGLAPVTVGFNPVQAGYTPSPPLNAWEARMRAGCPEDRTAHLHMVTYGPDLNLSRVGMPPAAVVDAGRKLTCYSPYLVPFSFRSPFFRNACWDGPSRRTYHRTGPRPAVLVFVEDPDDLVVSQPSLTRRARSHAEAGRIEFKAFDPCEDPDLYGSLLALLEGIVLDTTLPGRRTVPDAALHRTAARHGFRSPRIHAGAGRVLAAAARALGDDPDAARLEPLWAMHRDRTTPADALLARYARTGDILDALLGPAGAELRCVPS